VTGKNTITELQVPNAKNGLVLTPPNRIAFASNRHDKPNIYCFNINDVYLIALIVYKDTFRIQSRI
jgi:hypothetical protein